MQKWSLIILFFLALSCTKESSQINQNCFGDPDMDNAELCVDEFIPEKFCDKRYVGDYSLTEDAKESFPFYCLEVGETLTYVNPENAEMEFTVLSKGYYKSSRVVSQGPCAEDPEKALLDCIDHERAFVRIASDEYTYELELVTLPDVKDQTIGNVGDFLNIMREVVEDYYVNEWQMVVDKRTLSYGSSDCMIVHESIELNGVTYNDVFAFDESADCANYQYYVNHTIGLVGFRRGDNVLWTLK